MCNLCCSFLPGGLSQSQPDMKITRQKHTKKHFGFFHNNFGVRNLYQNLLDGTFFQVAPWGRIQLREQLLCYLIGETQLCTIRIRIYL
ncbi:rRNA-processing protein UTP23-like protein [Sciurus carolinensis]|uniref:rRNA-processing protein UTP23-like protein n=1 Tax=Sciurus carolinensis TaxID=30640 RepID=A0AA41T7W9_SCICA|nr:rRNA-processing protein UTP23-like protein [Sciurus carolinensis]